MQNIKSFSEGKNFDGLMVFDDFSVSTLFLLPLNVYFVFLYSPLVVTRDNFSNTNKGNVSLI